MQAGTYDGWVLKTVSDGPGLTVLEAAAAVGLTTVNDVRAIRAVRDKAVAAIVGTSVGLPVPETYFMMLPGLLAQVPDDMYPLVVKPADGSSGRGVHLVATADQLAGLGGRLDDGRPWLAQRYVPNGGTDLKVYSIRGDLWAAIRRSPLHPDRQVAEMLVPVSRSIARLAGEVGSTYGLDLFGMDVIVGPDGPMVVDVNDFPGFRCVPEAAPRIARAVLDVASTGSGYPQTNTRGGRADPADHAQGAVAAVDTGALVGARGPLPQALGAVE